MSDTSFGLRIGLEDEREFKKALTEINRQMRVLGSEMKMPASQFNKNDTSAAALPARSSLLSREVETQKAKIYALCAALDNAALSLDESYARTQNWYI